MRLSIITVNYRSWSHLAVALDGLMSAPEFTQHNWEMIVVDNASGDGKLSEFKESYPKVSFIENTGNNGFANGNNLGATQASGEMFLFMNPDVQATPDDIRQLLEEKKSHPDIGILTAPQLDTKGRLQKSFDRFPDLLTYFRTVRNAMRILIPSKNPDPRKHHNEMIDCDWISGSLVLMSKRDFDTLNGWSEDFWMYAEDMDLCKRAEQSGMRRAVTPKAQFIHAHGGASRQNPEVTLITKSEVMISAHVYVEHHFKGLHRIANHAILAIRNLTPLLIAGIANVLSLGLVPKLRLRSRLLIGLLRHYCSVLKTGVWLSRRSVNYSTKS